MGIETERKFLVTGNAYRQHADVAQIVQGFLVREPNRTVRVRIWDEHAFLTIKGPLQGASRLEFEYEIPLMDARALLKLCRSPLIEKTRYVVRQGGYTWEVDEFHGANEGLVMAEIEVEMDQNIRTIPNWVGKEVTDDLRYYNANLALKPYASWDETDKQSANENSRKSER